MIKLWIMSAAFEMAERGELSMDEIILLSDADKVPAPGMPDYQRMRLAGELPGDMFPESGVLNCLHEGIPLTILDLVQLMIVISDNTASNILIDRMGIGRINDHIRRLGAEQTVLLRKLFDTEAAAAGKENLFSLRETADYYRKMYRGELVSPDASRQMCAILQNQQNTYKIPFFCQDLPIAHKTGEDTGIANDAGIVFADSPFILCFGAGGTDVPQAVRACQEIARELVKHSTR